MDNNKHDLWSTIVFFIFIIIVMMFFFTNPFAFIENRDAFKNGYIQEEYRDKYGDVKLKWIKPPGNPKDSR